MADTAVAPASAPAPAEEKKKLEKPEKPDEEAHQAELKKLQKSHAETMAKLQIAKNNTNGASSDKNADTPQGKRKAEINAKLKEIRDKQAGGKTGRTKLFDDIKKNDEKLKSQIAELKAAQNKSEYRSLGDLEKAIADLRKQVDSSTMKMVDEKKALDKISKLERQKKQFAGFENLDKQIKDTKSKLAEQRSVLDDPEAKKLSEEYNTLKAELDVIKAGEDDAYKNRSSLRAIKDKLYQEQQEKWAAMQKLKDDHWANKKAFQQWEYEARQKHRERKKTEQAEYDKKKKLERAQKVLDEASEPAYLDEIQHAESLLRVFDPSYKKENAPLKAPSGLEASAQRTVDDSGIKGFKVVKKDEEDYFIGTGGKKGKKGKKGTSAETAAPVASKYSCDPAVMESCVRLGLNPPMQASEVESVRDQVKKKLEHFKSDQAAETARNIAKAKKEVERLDEADNSTPATPAETTNGHGHGETKATASVNEGGSVENEIALEENAKVDAAADLKGAKLEDKE